MNLHKQMKEFDEYDLEDEAIEFLKWALDNVERYDEIGGERMAVYIGKMLTIDELYSIYANKRI